MGALLIQKTGCTVLKLCMSYCLLSENGGRERTANDVCWIEPDSMILALYDFFFLVAHKKQMGRTLLYLVMQIYGPKEFTF